MTLLAVTVAALVLSGCSPRERTDGATGHVIKIAINPWIGYTPFVYLERSGELERLGFRIVVVSSLGENANLLSNHLVDGFAATQYEYLNYRDELQDIVPVFTIDRSFGADKIHSNFDIESLRRTDKQIHVYLEFGSCNEDLFKGFVKKAGLEKKRFVYHHDLQSVIKTIEAEPDRPVVVASYEPFSSTLERNGIHEVASTRDLDVPIVDALFSFKTEVINEKARFIALKKAFWRARKELEKDPKHFYEVIAKFLEGQDYDTFLDSLRGIRWLPEPTPDVIKTLEKQGIETEYLL